MTRRSWGLRLAALAALAVVCLAVPAAEASQHEKGLVGAARPAPAAAPDATAAVAERASAAGDFRRQLGRFGVVDVDRRVGTPRLVARLDGFLTAPSARSPRDIVLDYVRDRSEVFGLSDAVLGRLDVARSTGSSRGTRVVFAQTVDEIPVVGAGLVANVAADGRLINVGGSPLTVVEPNTLEPVLTAVDAYERALRALGVEANVPEPTGGSGPRRTTRFGARSGAKLVLVPTDGGLRLAWRVVVTEPAEQAAAVTVDAADGAILARTELTRHVDALVYPNYPGAAVGGSQTTVNVTPYVDTPGDTRLFGDFAFVWTDVNGDELVQESEDVPPSGGTNYLYGRTPFSVGGGSCPAVGCSWNHTVASSWQTNREQAAVQAFYYVNRFHDHLLASPIEFTPAKGNFEGEERVWIAAHAEADVEDGLPPLGSRNNAFMQTPGYGVPPLMTLLLYAPPSPTLSAAEDPSLVYHEYTHGLTSRLVSDADGIGQLDGPQGRALDEGTADFYALDYVVGLGHMTDSAAAGEIKFVPFLDPAGGDSRMQALDCPVGAAAALACPGAGDAGSGGFTYGDMGRILEYPEPHADGEIWAETLWDLRRRLIADRGATEGLRRTRLLVTAGLELSPWQPTFLDLRNAILQADTAFNGGQDRAAIWAVFAARGMGYLASALDAADVHPGEDFSLPPAAGGQTGTIAGSVTGLGGAPLAGATVWVGGHWSGFSSDLAAATDANGSYTITGAPVGTYPKVYALAPGGYDRSVAEDVTVTAITPAIRNFPLVRNWASAAGGGALDSFDGVAFSDCGPERIIDDPGVAGWSAESPANTDEPGPKALTIELPLAVDVAQFQIDPTPGCGRGITASLGDYTIETSTDGISFVVSASGTFTRPDTFQRNAVSPGVGTASDVRFVRLTAVTAQDQTPPFQGASWIGATELAVHGTAVAAPVSGAFVFRSTRSGGDTDVFRANADGSGSSTDLTLNAVADEDPVSSPDGSKLAFASTRDGNWEIYVMDADGTDVQRVTNHAAIDEFPTWSPDGTKLAFDSNRDGNAEIYVVPVTGGAPTRLTNNAAEDAKPSWSPWGDRIAFQSNRSGNYEVFVIPPAGGTPLNITNSAADDFDPAWSPRGTRIAFSSSRSGNAEIYTASETGAGVLRLTRDAGHGAFPTWSPDGRHLLFDTNRDGNVNVYRVAAAGGASVQIGADAAPDRDPSWLLVGAPDVVAPETTLQSGPTGTTASRSATFTFISNESGTFECSLDASAFDACTSPKTYNGLDSGEHLFRVRARDDAGVADPVPARRTWTVAARPGFLDFDGDGDAEIGVFRPANGGWYVLGQALVGFGVSSDIPVPGDYDGDGNTERAVFRPANGGWYVQGQTLVGHGVSSDVPVPGDYDGDGDTDRAVFRPSNGGWYVQGQGVVGFGLSTDVPVPADYDGDGDTDRAVFRRSNGGWYVQGQGVMGWGTSTDVPVPADYDGDGDADRAVFRPSTGGWHVQGQGVAGWGTSTDVPVPVDYDGDGDADRAVFRPSTGGWHIQGIGVFGWGTSSDKVLALPFAIRRTFFP